jgi:hypothetical protein
MARSWGVPTKGGLVVSGQPREMQMSSCPYCGVSAGPTGEKLLGMAAGVEEKEGGGTRRSTWTARGSRGGESLLAQTGAPGVREIDQERVPSKTWRFQRQRRVTHGEDWRCSWW